MCIVSFSPGFAFCSEKLLELEIYLEGPMCRSQWIGNYESENKNPSPVFLEVFQFVYHSTHTFLSRGRRKLEKDCHTVTQKWAEFS